MKARWAGIKGLGGSVYGEKERFVLVVDAKEIDANKIVYDCPFCKEEHRHGSSGEQHNRVESRSPHCLKNRKHDVEVVVSSATARV